MTTIRPLDLLDLPVVYRYRRAVLPLDSAHVLTRGNPLGPEGLLAYLDPSRHIYTAIVPDSKDTPLVGSVTHKIGETFARLVFLAPQEGLNAGGLTSLLEHLFEQAARWGIFHILAEASEDSPAFQPLRQAGFTVYAWQRIWDLSGLPRRTATGEAWQKMLPADLPALQGLYHHIIPALIQPVECYPRQAGGLICRSADGLEAHAALTSGPLGSMVQPLIHPDATQVGEKLTALTDILPRRSNRPIYLCVRSYQAWLEPVLEEIGASVGPRQAVMVRHLARSIREEPAAHPAHPAGISVQPSRISRTGTER